MSEILSEPMRSGYQRVVTEFYRWLPASVLFLFFMASGSTLYFTCAIAVLFGTMVSVIHNS